MTSDSLDVRILEQRLAEVQRVGRIGTWSINLAADALEWSDETCRIFGFLPGAPLPTAHGVYDLIHPEDRDDVRRQVRELLAHGQHIHLDYRILRRDGAVRWVHDHAEVERDASGRVARMYGTVQDVTERREAELASRSNEQQFRAIFDQAFQLVAMLTPEGTVIDTNRRSLEIIDVPREAVVGQVFSDAGWWESEPERQRCRDAILQASTGRAVRFETIRRDARGQRIHLDVSLSPVFDEAGKVTLLVAEGRDVSGYMKSEQARRDSEARFRAIFDNAFQQIHLLNGEGRVLAANPAALDGIGASLSQVIGQMFDETPWWSHDEAADRCREAVRRATAGEFVRFETRYPDGQGGWQDVDFSLTPVRSEAGKTRLLIAEAHDISARMRAERAFRESEARYRSLTELAPYGVVVHDFQCVVYANPAALRLIGAASLDELSGRPLSALVHPDSQELAAARIARIAQGETLEFVEEKLLRLDGAAYVAEVGGRAISWNGRPASQLVIRDISRRKQAEETQNRALIDLEGSNAELRELAYVTSHDLQEPLRTIVNYLQLIDRRDGARLSDESRRDLEVAVGAARHMSDVIKDLLAYARVDLGERETAAVSCREAAEQAIAHLAGEIKACDAHIRLDILPEARADRQQLVSLFQNLIGNAIKYRAAGRAPRIAIGAERGEAGVWIFSVRDNGIGIDPRHQDQIFKLFQRLHGQGSYGGTGIGLAICRKIVERHGGRIWVESKPGEGSVFQFTLPAAE